jgi:hypothetical protein
MIIINNIYLQGVSHATMEKLILANNIRCDIDSTYFIGSGRACGSA